MSDGIAIEDPDQAGLSGARINLVDAYDGDSLYVAGHALDQDGDQATLPDSGIVVTRVSATELTLSGTAPIAAYEQALGALALGTDDPTGLDASTRVVMLSVTGPGR